MDSNYLVVDKAILPGYYEKVVEARKLLDEGKVKDISEAVRTVGISRSTFYKYKDYVMALNKQSSSKRAILSMLLTHETGTLVRLLEIISEHSYSVWTINQNPPVNGLAAVVVALDMDEATSSLDSLIDEIKQEDDIRKVHLVGIE